MEDTAISYRYKYDKYSIEYPGPSWGRADLWKLEMDLFFAYPCLFHLVNVCLLSRTEATKKFSFGPANQTEVAKLVWKYEESRLQGALITVAQEP